MKCLSLVRLQLLFPISSNPRWSRLARWRRTDANNLSRLNGRQRSEAFWNDRKEILNPVRPRANDQDRNSSCIQILLVRQVFVECQQDIELRIGQSEQIAILLSGPPTHDDRSAFVANQV